jgi:hypothetical protein
MSKKTRPKNSSERKQSGRITHEKQINETDNSPYAFQRDKISFDLTIKNLPWTEKQKEIISIFLDKKTKVLFLKGPAGTSKAQPLDSKILTPDGWVTMADLKENDDIISVDGRPTKVISIHPQGEKDVFRITFSDGSFTECCDDHLWSVKTEAHRNYRIKKNGKKIKEAVAEESSSEISTSTLITDEGSDKINQQALSSAIKKTSESLINKILFNKK